MTDTAQAAPAAVADPAAPATSATETPAATEQTPAQLTAAQRARAAADKALEAARKNRERNAERVAVEQRARSMEAENQRLQAEARARRERDEEFRRDKRAAMKEYGLTAREIAQAELDESTPEGKYKTLEDKYLALEKKLTEKDSREETERQTVARQAAEQGFMKEAADATTYPKLAQKNPKFVMAVAKEVLRDAKAATGQVYSNAEVLSYLEKNFDLAVSESEKPSATAATATTETPASPRTLTNAAASTRLELPADFDQLSERQQRSHLKQALAKTMGKK